MTTTQTQLIFEASRCRNVMARSELLHIDDLPGSRHLGEAARKGGGRAVLWAGAGPGLRGAPARHHLIAAIGAAGVRWGGGAPGREGMLEEAGEGAREGAQGRQRPPCDQCPQVLSSSAISRQEGFGGGRDFRPE